MLMGCSSGFNGYRSHLNENIVIGKHRSNTTDIFLRDRINNRLCLENLFGNLNRVLPVFNEEKIQEEIGEIIVQNATEINLKVSMSPISDLWKRFEMSLGYDFIWKKVKSSRDSVLEFWSSWASCSEKDNIFCISAFKMTVLTICW